VAVLGLIPARGGSHRVPRKNLIELGGRSLVRRALETAVASAACDTVALSSEDEEILAEADGLGDVHVVRRPSELAGDDTRVLAVVQHALAQLEAGGCGRFSAVAIVQCTAPFTAPEDIAGCVDMHRRADVCSVVSVSRLDAAWHPLKIKRMEGSRLLPYIADDAMAPSHELPELWIRNGSVYVTPREDIERDRVLAEDVRGYVMPVERSYDIDTPRDVAFAEFMLGRANAVGRTSA
jgi:CMP-N-acetylneuraminic acid synthetase